MFLKTFCSPYRSDILKKLFLKMKYSQFFQVNFFLIMRCLLKWDKDILILAVLREVNTHAFQSIGRQQWNQTWIIFLELICYELKTFAHCVLYHLFLGLFNLFESFVEILENLRQEWRPSFIQRLSYSSDALLIETDGIH